ncbi:hypothetical protein DM02DRAFT_146729 [Periconia macrospinosa]|uniref:Uncharacterized protein n=1 Tax=Periconia macrospinosa TaxID=97972 RepID=A0A2V1DEH8_9PLEO|nr:hypothetical protein DM02DRAFT_146729 [Periconia macrospinosa]
MYLGMYVYVRADKQERLIKTQRNSLSPTHVFFKKENYVLINHLMTNQPPFSSFFFKKKKKKKKKKKTKKNNNKKGPRDTKHTHKKKQTKNQNPIIPPKSKSSFPRLFNYLIYPILKPPPPS